MPWGIPSHWNPPNTPLVIFELVARSSKQLDVQCPTVNFPISRLSLPEGGGGGGGGGTWVFRGRIRSLSKFKNTP